MSKFKTWLIENKNETVPMGECFQYAYHIFKNLAESGEDAALVHGTITNPYNNKSFPHAWVVWKNNIYDWQSNGKRSNRKEFKELWKPTVNKTYLTNDLTKVMSLLAKQGHYGPW